MEDHNNQKFENQEPELETKEVKPNPKKPIPKMAIIIGAVAVVVVAVAVALIILLGGNKNSGNDNDSANPPETPMHTHNFGEWETAKAATCSAEGIKERYCSCGEKQTTTIVMLEHNYIGGICNLCGKHSTDDNPTNHVHSFINQVCTECSAYDSNSGLLFEINADNQSYTLTSLGTCNDSTIYIDLYNNLPVTHINAEAFSNCITLEHLYIGNSIVDIVIENTEDCYEFFGCSNLETVVIGDGLTEIEDSLFESCEKLKNVTLGNNIRVIGCYAFDSTAISEIVFPDNLMYIKEGAFTSCDNLKTVTLGKEFRGCYDFYMEETSLGECLPMYYLGTWGVENITIHPDNNRFELINNCVVEKESKKLVFMCKTTIIPDGVEVIASGTIGWLYDKNIVIPNSVHTIERDKINCAAYLYMGSLDEWNSIDIDDYYDMDSTIHDINNVYFYSQNPPMANGNYWHYVDGVPTVWD